MKPPPTLRTIAKAAGVSHETVSRALRNDQKISSPTRQRIWKIAEKMGYRSNPLVQALMRSRFGLNAKSSTANVAFLKPIWSTPDFWARFPFKDQVDSTLERLRELGFEASELAVPEAELRSAHLRDVIHARGIRGLVIGSMPPSLRTLDLDWPALATVGFALTLREPLIDRVTTDIMTGMQRAMKEILVRGYQRPALAINPEQDERREYWLSAAWSRLQQQDIPSTQCIPNFYQRFDTVRVRRWFKRYRPDVILAFSPRYLDFLHATGLRIPEDVGFVQLETPSPDSEMSGIHTNVRNIGFLAAELLAEKLLRNDFGIPAHRHTILVHPDWTEGRTLRPRPASLADTH